MNLKPAKYILTLPPVARLAIEAMFEGTTNTTWWGDLPWEIINPLCAGLFIAFVINDLINPLSPLRNLLYKIRSPYILRKVIVNGRANPTRSALVALLYFNSAPKSSQVNVFMTPTTGKDQGQEGFVFSTDIGRISRKQEIKFELGSIMHSSAGWTPRHSVWGMEIGPENLASDNKNILMGQGQLVTIEIDGFRQSFLVRSSKNNGLNGEVFVIFENHEAKMVMGIK